MQMLNIKIANDPSEAPNYAKFSPEIKSVTLTDAIVVAKGMTNGKCTVDLQFKTDKGDVFVALVTGTILQMLTDIVKGVEARG